VSIDIFISKEYIMRHLLNDIPDWERNSIREQHKGGTTIDTSRFKKLMESKLGNVKPLINEMDDEDYMSSVDSNLEDESMNTIKVGLVDNNYFKNLGFSKEENPKNYTENYLKLTQEGLDVEPGLYYPLYKREERGEWFFLSFDDSEKIIKITLSKDYGDYSTDWGIGAEFQKSEFNSEIIPDTLDSIEGDIDWVYKFESLEKGSEAGQYFSENRWYKEDPVFVIL
jgi:hypothetical protein